MNFKKLLSTSALVLASFGAVTTADAQTKKTTPAKKTVMQNKKPTNKKSEGHYGGVQKLDSASLIPAGGAQNISGTSLKSAVAVQPKKPARVPFIDRVIKQFREEHPNAVSKTKPTENLFVNDPQYFHPVIEYVIKGVDNAPDTLVGISQSEDTYFWNSMNTSSGTAAPSAPGQDSTRGIALVSVGLKEKGEDFKFENVTSHAIIISDDSAYHASDKSNKKVGATFSLVYDLANKKVDFVSDTHKFFSEEKRVGIDTTYQYSSEKKVKKQYEECLKQISKAIETHPEYDDGLQMIIETLTDMVNEDNGKPKDPSNRLGKTPKRLDHK